MKTEYIYTCACVCVCVYICMYLKITEALLESNLVKIIDWMGKK